MVLTETETLVALRMARDEAVRRAEDGVAACKAWEAVAAERERERDEALRECDFHKTEHLATMRELVRVSQAYATLKAVHDAP